MIVKSEKKARKNRGVLKKGGTRRKGVSKQASKQRAAGFSSKGQKKEIPVKVKSEK